MDLIRQVNQEKDAMVCYFEEEIRKLQEENATLKALQQPANSRRRRGRSHKQ